VTKRRSGYYLAEHTTSRGNALAAERVAGPPPYGYQYTLTDRQHRRWRPSGAAGVITEIFQRYVRGEGYAWIAAELNLAGVPRSRGGRWCSESVYQILRNATYLGSDELGTAGPVRWPPLISRAVWDAAERRRKLRRS